MKRIFLLLIVFTQHSLASPIELKIEQIADRVSKDNFLVLENAQRVYQKKETIKFARANLLPKLNIWNLLKIPAVLLNPLGIGDIIQDVAPFLIPANWFKLEQSKHLYSAQKEQYRALWANELQTAKLLFYGAVRTETFLEVLSEKILKYGEVLDIAKTGSVFGHGNIFAKNLIEERYLALQEDQRNLKNLAYNEVKSLQYLAGVNNEEDVVLSPPELPSIAESKKIEFSKIIFKAIEASPEVYQYEHLVNALAQVKGQIQFNVLGTSTYSLGEGNGAFDNIPIQDGLGFGLGPSLRITKSEGAILKIQLKATVETIKKQVNILVQEYNSLIENYHAILKRIDLSEKNYSSMMDYLMIGGTVNVLEMVEILNNLFASKILLLSYEFRFSELVEKLKRITFSDDYSTGPVFVEGGVK